MITPNNTQKAHKKGSAQKRVTLTPLTLTLQALSPFVDQYAKIEAEAIAGYDDMRIAPRA